MHDNFIRNGHVDRILDGDSLHATLDLGFRVFHRTHIRIFGIDAPERGEIGWAESRAHLAELLQPGQHIVVECYGADKYGGRWLCDVRLGNGQDIGELMIARGFAVPYDGGRRGLGEQ